MFQTVSHELIKKVTNFQRNSFSDELRSLRNKIDENRYQVQRYRERMSRYLRDIEDCKRKIKSIENTVSEGNDEYLSKIEKDLNSVLNLDKVEGVDINENGEFIIYTNDLFINSSDGKTYVIGKYTIKININNTHIKFDSNIRRRSWWGEHCVHPHVSENGIACFGNIESTIAELCSQNELYALVTILIDYLESVNMGDPAGACVVYWDTIDEDGNIVPAVGKITRRCHISDQEFEDDEGDVCAHCDNDTHHDHLQVAHYLGGDTRLVCDECLEDSGDYVFDDASGEWMTSMLYDQVERERQENEEQPVSEGSLF